MKNGEDTVFLTDALSTLCLDACNGLEKEIPAVDNFKYRYYVSGKLSDGVSMPTKTADGYDYTSSENYFPHTMFSPENFISSLKSLSSHLRFLFLFDLFLFAFRQ